MNQIYARAFLEAEREVVLGETAMRKPDSVLEYTCFDQFASMTAHHAGPIFTETTRWQNIVVQIGTTQAAAVNFNVFMGNNKLDLTLERLVLQSLNNYVNLNFAHDFLGGTAGFNNNIFNAIGGPNYNCPFMQQIWDIAKCRNFEEDDSFMSFSALVAADPRLQPQACGGGTAITNPIIDIANNKGFLATNFDIVETYYYLMGPPGGTSTHGPIVCEPPVPTGVPIDRYTYNVDVKGNVTRVTAIYPDRVCPNPSCYYDYVAGTCNP